MPKYIDAHCHFNPRADYSVHGDVVGFICNSATIDDWADVVATARRYSNVAACIGIHPWYVADISPDWSSQMREILSGHSDIMVGEIGLDRARDNFDAQRDVFIAQMKIAAEYGRAVHVHCVRAFDVLLHVLKNIKILPPKIVLHNFGGGADIAHALMRYDNIYFSYGPRVVHQTPERIADVSVDKILIESDSYDPKISADVLPRVAEYILRACGLDFFAMADIIYENTKRVITNG